jgi:HSP20 family protein
MKKRNLTQFRKNHNGGHDNFGLNYLFDLKDQINEMIENVFSNTPMMPHFQSLYHIPTLNVAEGDKEVNIKVELPGMEEKDVKIETGNNQIIIKGERKEESEEKKKTYHIHESSYGEFFRTIDLLFDIDPSKATATFKNGMLEITIQKPKEDITKIKSIPIKKG